MGRPAVDPGKLLKYVAGDYNIHLLEPGVLYQDSGPVGPSGTKPWLRGKRGKANEIQNVRRMHPATRSAKILPPVLWTDRDLTFQDELGWPVDDAGEKLDGEFLPETPLEAATRRIESVLVILDDWDDWTTEIGGDEDEDGREGLARIRRMKCHLRRTLKELR